MADELAGVDVVVTGLVQGVFYRASTLEKAQSLSLTGSVRNLSDGSVEIVAEGPRHSLEELLSWCRVGPPSAQVEDVRARWRAYDGYHQTFRILR